MNIIDACQLKIGYGRIPLIHIPSLKIPHGSLIPLIGGNGSGKTSLLKTLGKLLPHVSGSLKLLDRKENELALSDVSFLPTQAAFFDKLTTLEHLELTAALCHQAINPIPILKYFRLFAFKNLSPSHLSAGQKKCLSLACLTIKRPKLILLDEPSSDLDQAHQQLLHRVMYDLCQKGSTCLFSTHQVQDVAIYNHVLKIESKMLMWHQILPTNKEDQNHDAHLIS